VHSKAWKNKQKQNDKKIQTPSKKVERANTKQIKTQLNKKKQS
jgi:hypothetical protein